MRIYELVIEPGREEHIARHGVSVAEVEEVIFGAPFIRRARHGRYHIMDKQSQVDTWRCLLLLEDKVLMAWSQPEMQMIVNVERIDDIISRNTHDKKRTRTAKAYEEPHTDL